MKFGRPFLGHVSSVWLINAREKEENFYKNNAVSLYHLYGDAQHKNPCPVDHDIYNFGRLFFDYQRYLRINHNNLLSLFDLCPVVEKHINTSIYVF